MKFSLKYFLLFLIIFYKIQAQSHFPLAKGNVWYYTYSCFWCQQPNPAPTRTIRVIGDTLMPNGNLFWILDQNDFFGCQYIRSDSNYLYYWYKRYSDSVSSERRIFNYYAKQGDIDTINLAGFMFARAEDPHTNTLFNISTIEHSFSLGGILFGRISIANGFGYTFYEFRGDEMYPFDDWTLTGCVLSDTLYGNLSSVHNTQELPTQIELFQNYPNPFNSWTIFQYRISKTEHVCLSITNLLGQQITILVNEIQTAGQYSAHYQAKDLSSGVYICNLTTSTTNRTVKFLYLK